MRRQVERPALRPEQTVLMQQREDRGNEGLMLKRTDAKYEAGRRGNAWRKVKRASGKGRRRNYVWRELHLIKLRETSRGTQMRRQLITVVTLTIAACTEERSALPSSENSPAIATLRQPLNEAVIWTKVPVLRERAYHSMVTYGSRLLMHGGPSYGSYEDATFAFDGAAWKRVRTTTITPGVSTNSAMAQLNGKVYLHGGSGHLDETWEFDGTDWRRLTLTVNPPPRSGHVMVTLGNKIVMFGGNNSSTWEFSGTAWTQRFPTTAAPDRTELAAAVLNGKIVVYGAGANRDRTAQWDGTNWTYSTTFPSPGNRREHVMATLGSNIILFGGVADSFPYPKLGDTWKWDGTAWSQLSPPTSPPARGQSAMAELNGALYLYAGQHQRTDRAIFEGDFWRFDGTTWTRLPHPHPTERLGAALAPIGNKLVLYGGEASTEVGPSVQTVIVAQTWEFDGDFVRLTPANSPPPLVYASAVNYGGKVVLFGGLTGTFPNYTVRDETWEWNGTDWLLRTPTNKPSARRSAAMATVGNKVLLFGGRSQTALLSDTWEWNETNWTQLSPTNNPGARYGATLSVVNGVPMLFGGYGATAFLNDVWEWTGTDWALRTVSAGPSARAGHATANLSPSLSLIVGQEQTNSMRVGETWTWEGTFRQHTPSLAPYERTWASLSSYGADRAVLYGGDDYWNSTSELWIASLIAGPGSACTAAAQCSTGFCVDGVCCNTACTGQCQACSTALGGQTNGSCSGTTGEACTDANLCTQTDMCSAGACVGSNAVTCTAMSQCHDVGTCHAGTGTCSNPTKADASLCNDNSSCTQQDACQSGTCVGANLVVCTAMSVCHDPGVCNPSTGACSNPNAVNGRPCSDGNFCTLTDTCQSGTCSAGTQVACPQPTECQITPACQPSSGSCQATNKTDGTVCSVGVCASGVCAFVDGGTADAGAESDAGTTTADAGTPEPEPEPEPEPDAGAQGSGGGAGGGATGPEPEAAGGCGCTTGAGAAPFALLVTLARIRRARKNNPAKSREGSVG